MNVNFLGYLSRDIGNIATVLQKIGFAMLDPREREEAQEALDAVKQAVVNLANAASEVKDLKGVSLSLDDLRSVHVKAVIAEIVADQLKAQASKRKAKDAT